MAAASAKDEPGPGAYGPSLTESWLVASQPSEIPVPAFGSSIARQAQLAASCHLKMCIGSNPIMPTAYSHCQNKL